MFAKLIFSTILTLSSFTSSTNLAPFAQYQISRLLQNMTHCDVQIVHDGTDIVSFQIPVKVINILDRPIFHDHNRRPNHEDINLPSAINLLSSRSPENKLSFLLSKEYMSSTTHISDVSRTKLRKSVILSSVYHLFYIGSGQHKRIYHEGNKMFVIVLTTKPNEENNLIRKIQSPLHAVGKRNVAVLSYLTKVLIHKVCFIPISFNIFDTSLKDRYEIIDWDQRISRIATWQIQWCYKAPYIFKRIHDDLVSTKSNPFDRTKTYTIQNLALISLLKANMTIAPENMCSVSSLPEFQINYEFENTILGENLGLATHIPIITRTPGLQCFTCYREEYQPYEIYAAPFQHELWFALLVTLALTVVLAAVYKHYSAHGSISFSAWLFILATMFEETGHVPSRIERNTQFRLAIGVWCLMSVILTNCYNGLMISELNAPFPAFQPGEFSDLLCRKLSQNTTDYFLSLTDPKYLDTEDKIVWDQLNGYIHSIASLNFSYKNNPYEDQNCFKLLSVLQSSEGNIYRMPEFVSFLFRVLHIDDFLMVRYGWPRKHKWDTNFSLSKQINLFISLSLAIYSHRAVCGRN